MAQNSSNSSNGSNGNLIPTGGALANEVDVDAVDQDVIPTSFIAVLGRYTRRFEENGLSYTVKNEITNVNTTMKGAALGAAARQAEVEKEAFRADVKVTFAEKGVNEHGHKTTAKGAMQGEKAMKLLQIRAAIGSRADFVALVRATQAEEAKRLEEAKLAKQTANALTAPAPLGNANGANVAPPAAPAPVAPDKMFEYEAKCFRRVVASASDYDTFEAGVPGWFRAGGKDSSGTECYVTSRKGAAGAFEAVLATQKQTAPTA